MSGKIETTGQLREYLVTMMQGVKNGDVKVEVASVMTKMAAQVNESFYSEIKIARVARETGGTAKPLGQLPINTEKK